MSHSAIGLAPTNAVFKREIYPQFPNYFSPADEEMNQAAIKTLHKCPLQRVPVVKYNNKAKYSGFLFQP